MHSRLSVAAEAPQTGQPSVEPQSPALGSRVLELRGGSVR